MMNPDSDLFFDCFILLAVLFHFLWYVKIGFLLALWKFEPRAWREITSRGWIRGFAPQAEWFFITGRSLDLRFSGLRAIGLGLRWIHTIIAAGMFLMVFYEFFLNSTVP